MNIISALRNGMYRSTKAWKSLLVIWFFYLLMTALLASPIKSAFSAGLGNSTITQMFSKDLNMEFLTDMGSSFSSVASFLRAGVLLLIIINIPVNAFFTGGLFRIITREDYSTSDFWNGASANFWSFLVISLLISLMVLASFFIFMLPLSFLMAGDGISDVTIVLTGIVLFVLFFMWLGVLLLVADLSRSWQSAFVNNRCFAAIGYGFRQAFRIFFRGWPMMLLLMIIQCLFIFLVAAVLRRVAPQTSFGVLLLFIGSQLLFFLRIFLRAVRYGSVVSLI